MLISRIPNSDMNLQHLIVHIDETFLLCSQHVAHSLIRIYMAMQIVHFIIIIIYRERPFVTMKMSTKIDIDLISAKYHQISNPSIIGLWFLTYLYSKCSIPYGPSRTGFGTSLHSFFPCVSIYHSLHITLFVSAIFGANHTYR